MQLGAKDASTTVLTGTKQPGAVANGLEQVLMLVVEGEDCGVRLGVLSLKATCLILILYNCSSHWRTCGPGQCLVKCISDP